MSAYSNDTPLCATTDANVLELAPSFAQKSLICQIKLFHKSLFLLIEKLNDAIFLNFSL